MNYKEINMQNLAVNIKKLLDDPEVTPEELFELVVLTVGENINTHRDAMERAKALRDKMMSTSNSINSFVSSSSSYDTISFDNLDNNKGDIDHSYHYYQHNRNK